MTESDHEAAKKQLEELDRVIIMAVNFMNTNILPELDRLGYLTEPVQVVLGEDGDSLTVNVVRKLH